MGVVDQQPALVESEIPLAEAVAALVLLAHVPDDHGVQGGRRTERLQRSLLFGAASRNVMLEGGHDVELCEDVQ